MTLSLRDTRHEIVSQAHKAHNRDIVSADTIDLVFGAMSGIPGMTYADQKHRFRVVREALKPFTGSDEVRAIRKLAKKAIKEIDRRSSSSEDAGGGYAPQPETSPSDMSVEAQDVEEVPLPESLMSYFNSLTAEPPVQSLTVSFGDGTPHAFYTLEEAKRILSENG